MKFTKMQGLGNDYVYVNCFEETVNDPEKLAIAVSDRHFGIGSDGLILITPSEVADCRMDMYNLDGSRGAMCGNGIRCVGKYAYDHHIVDKPQISVETLSGIKYLDMKVENGKVTAVTVDMGEPEQTSELPEQMERSTNLPEFPWEIRTPFCLWMRLIPWIWRRSDPNSSSISVSRTVPTPSLSRSLTAHT